MTTDDKKVTTVRLSATIVREQEDVLTLRLDDGFASQEIRAHRDVVIPSPTDDFIRLPLLMAAEMTRKLRMNAHKGGRGNWLADGPKALLKRLKEEVAELEDDIRLHPEKVLAKAADVANFAMMVADKADKLEPMPELVELDSDVNN